MLNVEELEKQVAVAKIRLDRAIEKISQPGSANTDWDEYEDEYHDAFEAFSSARQVLAIMRCEEYVIPHDVGLKPSPSGSAEIVIQTAESTFVIFLAISSNRNTSGLCSDMGVAIVECVGCRLTKFGYPNDEGRKEHPLYHKGLEPFPGIGEVINSTWNAEPKFQMETSARRIHGDGWDTYQKIYSVASKPKTEQVHKHFIFEFKDNVFECIARELKVTLSNESYQKILSDLNQLILSN